MEDDETPALMAVEAKTIVPKATVSFGSNISPL
jgi:hypothetical protein